MFTSVLWPLTATLHDISMARHTCMAFDPSASQQAYMYTSSCQTSETSEDTVVQLHGSQAGLQATTISTNQNTLHVYVSRFHEQHAYM